VGVAVEVGVALGAGVLVGAATCLEMGVGVAGTCATGVGAGALAHAANSRPKLANPDKHRPRRSPFIVSPVTLFSCSTVRGRNRFGLSRMMNG
jgi:hypothetical protein